MYMCSNNSLHSQTNCNNAVVITAKEAIRQFALPFTTNYNCSITITANFSGSSCYFSDYCWLHWWSGKQHRLYYCTFLIVSTVNFISGEYMTIWMIEYYNTNENATAESWTRSSKWVCSSCNKHTTKKAKKRDNVFSKMQQDPVGHTLNVWSDQE